MIQSKTYAVYDEQENNELKFTVKSAYKIMKNNKFKKSLNLTTGPIGGNLGDL
ncbi:MAG: hypothetical protein ACR2F1_00410 [Nitrososphaeraceae archaeon]